ncbi:MAG: tartrate dehydrogenase [Candidatus Omnitrophica bacterium]|nr:putative tartrate dehydrogenase/decarboxylase TtuC' [bacterium]NUN97192.1 tartrate dehydrogenase [Candidatus Omnitrophota bacterium]
MESFQIAVYPGDGIGVEVAEAALQVLDKVQAGEDGFKLNYTRFPWGADYCLEHGKPAPENYLEILSHFDAVFLGALGDPKRVPDHIALEPLISMRQKFDQYACVRPAKLFPGVRTPLADKKCGDIDMVVVRENSEGEYVNNGGRFREGTPEEFAVQTGIHTRKGIERILRFGFNLATQRTKRLAMITKSNAQRYSFVLWDEILEEMKDEFPDIEVTKNHIDAAVMNFVRWPERFDVVVGSNLFGDILTDLSGILIGGLGLAPSANINPERKFPSMFEPVHGSAPDIAGQGIANPTAAILSAALMLDWLGFPDSAEEIRGAVERTLSAGQKTPDLGGNLSTQAYTDKVLEALEKSA